MTYKQYKYTNIELAMKFISVAVILFTSVYGLYMYSISPEILPSHFNLFGKADSFGSRQIVLVIVAINILLYFILSYAASKPKYFNYPVRITEKNGQLQYENIMQLQVRIKWIISIVFLFLVWLIVDYERVIQLNLEKAPFILIVTLVLVITYYVWKAFEIEKRLR